jgi:hypothetical protein
MPRVDAFLLAKEIIVDQATGLTTLFSLVEELTIQVPPQLPPDTAPAVPMNIFVRWLLDDDERLFDAEFAIRCTGPDGKRLLWEQSQPLFEQPQRWQRIVVSVAAAMVGDDGRHTLDLYLLRGRKRSRLARTTFLVRRVPHP